MSFIAKNPLSAAKLKSEVLPPLPPNGTMGLFPREDGWYEIDDDGNIRKLATGEDVDSATAINAEKLNALTYYGDMNIVPSDASLFTFTTDDETMTASVSAASNGISGDIVIPYQYVVDDKVYLVTRIEKHGFYTCNNLTSVIVPNSVTVISNSSFYGCGGLTNITIGNGITSIESNAFIDCKKLENIVIPNGVTNIGAYAFGSCYKLTNVTIPNSVTNIESCTFSTCSGLTNITIPKSVTNIGSGAFANCYHLINVYYESTEEEWNAITISDTGNEPLLSATIHYNWVPAMKGEVDQAQRNASTALIKVYDIEYGNTAVPSAINADCATMDRNGDIIADTYATKEKLTEVESIAKGANQAVSFENYQLMYEDLSVWSEKYHVGQNIYIKTLNVPDLWISEIIEYDDGFDYVQTLNPPLFDEFDEAAFLEELKANGSIQVGVYVVSMLETQKVDLTEYATKEEVSAELGKIDTALDNIIAEQEAIIAIQESLYIPDAEGVEF